MLRNIIPKNKKLLEMLPELEKKLKKQLITWNCAACRFKNILRLWNILFRL